MTANHATAAGSARGRWLGREARVSRLGAQTMLFGPGASTSLLARELRQRAWRHALILVSARSAGLVKQVTAALPDGASVTDIAIGAPAHAPAAHTEELHARYQRTSIDVIVGIGGGSVTDTAKGLAVLLGSGGRLQDWCVEGDRFRAGERPSPLPVVAVPTTLSGAEATSGAGVLHGGRKHTLWAPGLAPAILAYDDDVLAQTDAAVLVSTGMNAIAHAAEALYSPEVNPVVTALAGAAAERLASGLRALAGPDPSTAFADLAAGAAMGGITLGQTRVALHHAICHALGAVAGIAHGDANAVMLPHVLRFNEPHTGEGQRLLAASLGDSGTTAADAIDQLGKAIGAPRRLRDIGVAREQFARVASETMEDHAVDFNPAPVGAQDVMALLETAY